MDVLDVGKGVVCTKVFERGDFVLCNFNGLLLDVDETSAHVKRCEVTLSYDTSYLFMFKC